MRPSRPSDVPPSARHLAVEWRDCAWSPGVVVRAARARSARGAKSLIQPPVLCETGGRHFKNMKSKLNPTRRAAFTLVELLVVIAIIAILAGMLLPVLSRAKIQAQKTQAKTEMSQIVAAIQKYDSDYGRFPVSTNAQATANNAKSDFTYGGTGHALDGSTWTIGGATNSEVIAILMNFTNYPNTSIPTVNVNGTKNPQGTIFLNAKMSGDTNSPGVGNDLVYRDPWGNPYIISMDLNYDENTSDVVYSNAVVAAGGIGGLIQQPDGWDYRGKVMVWSAGPDRKFDVNKPANQDVNKDNITSWQ